MSSLADRRPIWLSNDVVIAVFLATTAIAVDLADALRVRFARKLGRLRLGDLAVADRPGSGGRATGHRAAREDVLQLRFGSDLLAGISIVTVGSARRVPGRRTLVVLMLSGGQALEAYAVRSASSALEALARRMPSVAHRSAERAGRRRVRWTRSRSATRWWSSRTRPARSTASCSKAAARWTSRT